MLDKFAIASALREIGILLELKGENPYKARAYENGAAAVEGIAEELGQLVDEKRLTKYKGIGEALASKIAELYNTGRSSLLEELRAELPPGIIELSQIPGLSTKKVQMLHDALGISSIAELQMACEINAISKVKGFGEKTQQKILEGIKEYETRDESILLVDARQLSRQLTDYFKFAPGVSAVTVVGSIRRWKESIKNINLLVTSTQPNKAIDALEKFPQVTRMESTEDLRAVARLANGMRVSLLVTTADHFPFAEFVETGSQSHIQEVRKIAERKGYTISSTGLMQGDRKVACRSEQDIYKELGLPFIPPELREANGEIDEVAAGNDFSDLIEIDDIQGMTHCHSTYSDGKNSIEEMALAAEAMGMNYITITDHSPSAHYAGGVVLDQLKRQWDEIDRVQERVKIKLLKGTESDILDSGALDYPDDVLNKFDILIGSIHSRLKMDEDQMTKRLIHCMRLPQFKIWGHALGRLVLRRPPLACRLEEVLDAAAESNVAIEVNGDPYRLDMEARWIKLARKRGIKFVISTDAHGIRDLQNLKYGVHMARRGGLSRSEVLNTLSVDRFRKAVAPIQEHSTGSGRLSS
ncbi:MAG: DNA polymerase/3'-5' exonuclease PolX [Cyanobacteria bacterium SZAS-4]|nr:DNA polymerase/3'-5' exonuclease PolX [Cyanobacteria bacterium SZAS-4]